MPPTSEADGTTAVPPMTAAQKDRALHVLVPEKAIVHAHHAALDSKPRMPFRHFIAQLLLEAKPIVNEEGSTATSKQDSST